jgi:hypothetical protein
MVRWMISGALLFVLSTIGGGFNRASGGDVLSQELQELDQMRNGKKTPFDEVDRRGKGLLKEHTSPVEQGQIYCHLALVNAQSGLFHPELVIDYAQRALQFPLEPYQRLLLCTYLGDALRAANREKRPFHEIRKMAALPYLEGLNEAQKHQLPKEKPQLPAVDAFDVPKESPWYEKMKKKHDEQWAARKQAEINSKLWDQRRILTGQIVEIYSRKPHAATELREMATKILEDPAAVNALMKLIEEKGALKDDPIPAEPEKGPKGLPPNVSPWRVKMLAVNVLAIVVLLLIFLLRQRRRRRQARSIR